MPLFYASFQVIGLILTAKLNITMSAPWKIDFIYQPVDLLIMIFQLISYFMLNKNCYW